MLQLQITDQKDSEVNEKFPYIHQVKKKLIQVWNTEHRFSKCNLSKYK